MKAQRHKKIIDIVSKYNIETQEELIARLSDSNFEVTQATISRDIRELKLIKVSSGQGGYRYTLPEENKPVETKSRFHSALSDSIITIDYAVNNVVIKTYPGLANAVATGIDGMSISDILGCVAGDDTIIIVMRNEKSAQDISERIRELIKQ